MKGQYIGILLHMRKSWEAVTSHATSYRKAHSHAFPHLETNKATEKKNKADCLNAENGLCESGRGVLRTGMTVEEGRGDLIRGWL